MHGHTPVKQGSSDPNISFMQVYVFADGVFLVEVANVVFRFWPTGEWAMYEFPALSSQIARCREYTVYHGESALTTLIDYLYK